MPDGGAAIGAALARHGVRRLFTLCGGHISPVLAGAKRAGIAVIDVRDEATAVFAADATARLTGVPGAAAVTAGPGVTNALTALQNARLAQSPVVLLAGAAPTVLRGRGALQDIPQLPVLRPHVKWLARARRVRELVPLLGRAFREAVDGVPGPVALECAVDLLYDERIVREWYVRGGTGGEGLGERLQQWYLRRHLDRVFVAAPGPDSALPPSPHVVLPSPSVVSRAAEWLQAARRPILLVGSQAVLRVDAVPDIARAAAALRVPTYLTGMARGLVGREHDWLFRHGRRRALAEADLVILAGVTQDFRLDYGRQINLGARVVAANRRRADARRNRRPQLLAVGDAGAFLEAVARALPDGVPRPEWQAALRAAEIERDRDIAAAAADRPAELVSPLHLLTEVERVAAENAVFVLDGGDFAATAAYVVRPRGPLGQLDPGPFGTLGVGGGFALGAALTHPRAEVWVLYGDGAAGFSLAEFDTFVRHGLAPIAVVGNDASWEQIARDQRHLVGDDVGTVLRHTDYQVVAEGFGGVGLAVRSPGEVRPALERARALAREGRPVLVNVWLARSTFREGSVSL